MIDLNLFFTGFGLGGIVTYIVKKIFEKYIDQKFNKDNLKFQKSIERYERLYCPLVKKIMGISIESSLGSMSLKLRVRLAFKALLKMDFHYVSHVIKLKSSHKIGEYYLESFSEVDFKGMKDHISKYHKLADPKLLDLLDSTIRSEREDRYIQALNRSIDKKKHYNDNKISLEFYKLIMHIDKYSKDLNKKLFY